MPRIAAPAAVTFHLTPAARRVPAACASKVQCNIRHDGGCRYRCAINTKAQQMFIEDASPGCFSEMRAVHNRTQFARDQRVFLGGENLRGQQTVDEQPRSRPGGLRARDGGAFNSQSMGQPRRLRHIFGRHCSPDFMYGVPLLAVVWTKKICPI